tara:strand:+ start:809 stop:1921 length:1113 start_codon:yes stop_codon:yes gene_type:complete
MVYLTFNDPISGVYKSQVIDVLHSLNKINKSYITLISFFSLRNYLSERRKLKRLYPKSISLPMFPKLKNWKLNAFILKLFINEEIIICRGVFATNIALAISNTKSRIIYDGRGAVTEEYNEFNVGGDFCLNEIKHLEKNAVLKTFFRISVSSKLVEYWINKFGYNLDKHVVIPCTLSYYKEGNHSKISRKDLNFGNDDIVIVFSGGTGLWQSYNLLIQFLEKFLLSNKKVKILFLCKENHEINSFIRKYKSRVFIKWVNFTDVFTYLSLADYGIVVREESITNLVSSPVKIAEYLSCGLKILISKKIGDSSDFIVDNDLGHILDEKNLPTISGVSIEEKKRIKNITNHYFHKKSNYIQNKFEILIHALIS